MSKREYVAIAIFATLGWLLIAASLISCGAQCKALAQRCNGGRAQLCDTAGKWRTVIRCEDVRPGKWSCACQDGCTCRRMK